MTERNDINDKAMIRNDMSLQRNSLTKEERKRWSEAACAKAAAWLEDQSANSFMVYIAFRSELDLSSLVEWGWRTGRDVIVPRCNAADRSMTLHVLERWDQLIAGAYGILEPNPLYMPALEEGFIPEFVFVPGLAFDRKGGRLGYGGGYYDRFAKSQFDKAGAHGRTSWIGAAFETQIIASVPMEPHDLPLHRILTELDMYKIN